MSDNEFEMLRKINLCNEVCADLLVGYFFEPKMKEAIDGFIDTLPKLNFGEEELSKEETALYLLPGFLYDFVEEAVKRHTNIGPMSPDIT